LRDCDGKRIVGVFGAAHIQGIIQHLNEHHIDGKILREQLCQIPPPNIYSVLVRSLFIFVFVFNVFSMFSMFSICLFTV
jgi:pheromone shutdown protein TraB